MTNKDRDEIREILAKALSDSLIGKVEQNIMNVLSPKLGALQTKAAEAEAKTDASKAELIKVTNLITSAEAKLAEFKETRIRADKEFEEVQKDRAQKTADLNKQLSDHSASVREAEIAAGNRVRAAQTKADQIIADLEANIAAEKFEFEKEKKAHEEFRKVVGLG